MSSCVEHHDEVEVVNAGVVGDIPDDVVATYVEWDFFLYNFNTILGFIRYRNQRRELMSWRG